MWVLALGFLASCAEDVIIDPTLPQGEFTVTRSGNLVDQNGAGSMGVTEIGTDEEGTQFLRLGNNFTTKFSTGTVTVYLSTSETYVADPGNGNPALRLLGVTSAAGEQYFRIAPAAGNNFTHVIIWCASAGIPFGNARLQ